MTPCPVEDQLARLRPAVASGLAVRFHLVLLAGAGIGVILAVVLWHPVPLMLAAFLGLVGFAEQRAGPNLAAAVAAYDTAAPVHGDVSVTITRWDTDNSYLATVCEPGQPTWQYEFIPQGWQPVAQTYPARIWRSGAGAPPVLAAVEEGILIPRGDPTRVPGTPGGVGRSLVRRSPPATPGT